MSGETVLLVEDNPINLKLARALLIRAGYTVHGVTDAEEAQMLLKTLRPELILMDIQLPGMDGLTLAHLLKSDPATCDIPIVALTAYTMQGDEQKALDAGCDGYIPKPLNTRTFQDVIKQYQEKARVTY